MIGSRLAHLGTTNGKLWKNEKKKTIDSSDVGRIGGGREETKLQPPLGGRNGKMAGSLVVRKWHLEREIQMG